MRRTVAAARARLRDAVASPALRRLLGGLVLAGYAAWALLYVARTSFEVDGTRVFTLWDDGMVSMRYADHLVQGRGLVWNDGERVQGFSDPGMTLLMALVHLVPLAPETRSLPIQLLSVGVLVAIVVLAHQVASLVFDDAWAGRVAAALVMACAPIAVFTLQGTDVGLVVVLLLLALRSAARGERSGDGWPTRVWVPLGLATLVRVDSAVPFAVMLALGLRVPGARAGWWRGAAILAAAVAVPMLAAWLYFGDPLPNTYYLKATGSPRALVLASGATQVLDFLATTWPLCAAALAGALIWFRHERLVHLLGALFGAACAYHLWVGGDWLTMHFGRFIAPALPMLAVLFAGVVVRLARTLQRDASAGGGLRTAGAAALVAGITLAASPSVSAAAGRREWLDPAAPTLFVAANETNYRMARYLKRWLDPGTVVGLHWAGVPAYFSGLPAVDVLGKTEPHIARLVVDRFVPAHSKWDWRWVVNDRRPDVLVGASRGLGAREDFKAAYRRVRVPGISGGAEIFIRAESVARLRDPGATPTPIPE